MFGGGDLVEDDVAHPSQLINVLEHNHRLLRATRAETSADEQFWGDDANPRGTTEIRFDVRHAPGDAHFGECRLDLQAAVEHLASPTHAAEGKRGTHVVVQSMRVEAVRNTHPCVDVFLTCKQGNRVKGNFQRTTATGNTKLVEASQMHKLFVLHAGTDRGCHPPAQVHQASPFCRGQIFRDFYMALDKTHFEQHVSPIMGTDYVEFVTPDLYVTNDVFDGRGCWVMDIARNNLSKSERPFAVNFIPDDQDPNRQRVGFRMWKGDWKALRDAIVAGITVPLGEEARRPLAPA